MHLDRGNFFILAISLCPPTCTSAYISSKCFPVFFFTFTVSQLTDLLACNAILTKYTEESSTFCCLTHQMTSVAFPNVIYDLKICKLKQSSCDIYALHCVRKKTLTMRWTKETVQNEGAGNLQNYSVFSFVPLHLHPSFSPADGGVNSSCSGSFPLTSHQQQAGGCLLTHLPVLTSEDNEVESQNM